MTIRNTFSLGVGALALCLGGSAFAQASFTIRRPLDGATVREKVRVEIPRDSLKPGAFVAFFIDDKFVVAQAPDDEAPAKLGAPGAPATAPKKQPFIYQWDTKATKAADGEHKLRAVLFEPAAGAAGSVTETQSSEVKVTIANKIKDGPTTLQLRYKYREGESLEYSRNSAAKLKGGEVEGAQGTGDTELGSVRSQLILGVEDSRPGEDISLVRNKLTSLQLLTGGQEITAAPDQLSESMYQELDSRGRVLYETGSLAGLAQFASTGLPVNGTLELPLLPITPVSVGETWRTPNQRIDIPGLPPALQPRVLLESKLEGLEWENNRQTAKVRQVYKGELPAPITISGMHITTPSVEYERTIYIAYKSGVLVRMTRNLTIKGRSADAPVASPAAGVAGGGGGGMQSMMAGMMGMGRPGAGAGATSGAPPGMMQGMMAGMMGGGRRGAGATSGPPPGMMQGMMGMGMMGTGGGRSAQRTGRTGRSPQRNTRGAAGGSGMMGMGMMGDNDGPVGKGGGSGRAFGGASAGSGMAGIGRQGGGFVSQAPADHAVTIEAVQDTEILKVSNAGR